MIVLFTLTIINDRTQFILNILISVSRAFVKLSNNKHKKNTIDKIVKLGEKVIVKIVFRSNNEIDVLSKETELILSYGRNDNKTGILTNLTNGGEGISGYIPTKELKELWSKIRKGSNNGMYNKKHTQESLNKMSEICLEKYKKGEILPTIHTEEWKQHLRTNNPSAKKVDDKFHSRFSAQKRYYQYKI